MAKSIERRIERVEEQLCIDEEPVVFEYTDDKGVKQKVEMSSIEFDKMLREIRARSKGLPVREGLTV